MQRTIKYMSTVCWRSRKSDKEARQRVSVYTKPQCNKKQRVWKRFQVGKVREQPVEHWTVMGSKNIVRCQLHRPYCNGTCCDASSHQTLSVCRMASVSRAHQGVRWNYKVWINCKYPQRRTQIQLRGKRRQPYVEPRSKTRTRRENIAVVVREHISGAHMN